MPKHIQCALASLAACLLGSAVIGYATVAEWLAPSSPVLFLLAAALGPALLSGLMVAAPSDGKPWDRPLILMGIIPGLILGLLAVGLGAQWHHPKVRAAVAGVLSPDFQNATPLLRALDDPSSMVATRACEQLVEADHPRYRLAVREGLRDQPQTALKCLQGTHASPRAEDYLLSLAGTWHQALIDGISNTDQACELSDAMGAIEAERPTQTTRLLHCALLSEDPVSSACCAKAVHGRHETITSLEGDLQAAPDVLVRLGFGPKLLAGAFFGHEHFEDMDLKTSTIQRLGLQASCDILRTHPTEVLTVFYKVSDSLGCFDSGQEPPTNVDTWRQACTTIQANLNRDHRLVPGDAFCSAIGEAEARRLQVEQADRAKRPGQNPELAALSDGIVIGHTQESLDQTENWRETLAEEERLWQEEGLSEEEIQARRAFAELAESARNEFDPEADDEPEVFSDEAFQEGLREMVNVAAMRDADEDQLKHLKRMEELMGEGDLRPREEDMIGF
ncbi:MAG: hypothetical protein ACNA8W_13745 [Bradymonadaceae bacterium]